MDGRLIEMVGFSADKRHAVELLPTVDAVCRRHGWEPDAIDEVYVSSGPGSFTGLRVGITFSRTLAMATGAKVVAAPTLEVIAQNAAAFRPEGRPGPPERVAVVLDAKRKQVYGALFGWASGRYGPLTPPTLGPVSVLLAGSERPLWVMGEGVPYHRAAIDDQGVEIVPEEFWPARAEHVYHVGGNMAAAGKYTDFRSLIPHYIRRPEAEEVWEQRHGQP